MGLDSLALAHEQNPHFDNMSKGRLLPPANHCEINHFVDLGWGEGSCISDPAKSPPS